MLIEYFCTGQQVDGFSESMSRYWAFGEAVGFDSIKLLNGVIVPSKAVMSPGFRYSVLVEDKLVIEAHLSLNKWIRVKCDMRGGRMFIPSISAIYDREVTSAGSIDLPVEMFEHCSGCEILDVDSSGKLFKYIKDEV